MTTPTPIIYTREDLKGLKAEEERKIHEQNVDRFIQQISSHILSIAKTTNNTSIVISRGLPAEKVITDTILELKKCFIDVSIEYKFQTDIRTGRDFNHGVYIDWS